MAASTASFARNKPSQIISAARWTRHMEPPATPGGSAAQDIFSVFAQGFDDDEGAIVNNEWFHASPVLPDLLPAPELPTVSPDRPWPRSMWLGYESSPPHVASSRSPDDDPREMLIHRLNGLISQIGSDSSVDGIGLAALHGIVDQMEDTLEEGNRPTTQESQPHFSQGRSPRWVSEAAPADGLGLGKRTQDARRQRTRHNHLAAEIRNQRIVQEAHTLSNQMEAMAKSLLERQEETEVSGMNLCGPVPFLR